MWRWRTLSAATWSGMAQLAVEPMPLAEMVVLAGWWIWHGDSHRWQWWRGGGGGGTVGGTVGAGGSAAVLIFY